MTARKLIIVLALILFPAACLPGLGGGIETREISFQVDERANDGYAIELDIVFVFDEALAKTLEAYSARSWFRQKQVLIASHAGALSVRQRQAPPNSFMKTVKVSGRERDAVACLLFANYIARGEHRLRLGGLQKVQILLGPRAVSLATQE
jgi:type VI secretion system protein